MPCICLVRYFTWNQGRREGGIEIEREGERGRGRGGSMESGTEDNCLLVFIHTCMASSRQHCSPKWLYRRCRVKERRREGGREGGREGERIGVRYATQLLTSYIASIDYIDDFPPHLFHTYTILTSCTVSIYSAPSLHACCIALMMVAALLLKRLL